MTVSKTVFIGAVAFVPAAILHGCGGDDKNKAETQTGVRPAGGDNGGSGGLKDNLKVVAEKGKATAKKIQEKGQQLKANASEVADFGKVKDAVSKGDYAAAWAAIKDSDPDWVNIFVEQNDKKEEELTDDEKKQSCLEFVAGKMDDFQEKVKTGTPDQKKAAQAMLNMLDDEALLQKLQELDEPAEEQQLQEAEAFDKLKEAVDKQNYAEAWDILKTNFASVVNQFATEQGKAEKDLTADEKKAICDKYAEDDGSEDAIQDLEVASSEPAVVKKASVEDGDAELDDELEVDEEELNKKIEEFLKQKGVESIDELTEDQRKDLGEVLHLQEDGDFKPVVDKVAADDATDAGKKAFLEQLSAAMEKIEAADGKDKAHQVWNRIMMEIAEEKGKSVEDLDDDDFTQDDYNAMAQQLKDHTFEFADHLEKAQATDKVAEKVFAALKEIVRLEDGNEAAEEVETNFPKMLQEFVREQYPADKEKTAADLTEDQKKEFVENLKAKEIEELKVLLEEGTPEQKDTAKLILAALQTEDGDAEMDSDDGASGSGAEPKKVPKRNAPDSAGETQQDPKRARRAQRRQGTMAPTGQ